MRRQLVDKLRARRRPQSGGLSILLHPRERDGREEGFAVLICSQGEEEEEAEKDLLG